MQGILLTCTHRKQVIACLIAMLMFFMTSAQNAIQTENALTGNFPSEWDIVEAGDETIQGYATDISVNRGNRINFKIKTDANAYTIQIYRLGYYDGRGARKWADAVVSATLPQTQPDPIEDPVTGIADYGNWAVSGYWDVPADAVSGYYIALLTRSNGGKSHIPFIVRDDASTSDLFFQASDATWQAYNNYGGNSLYNGATSYPQGRAVKVSYNRPFRTRAGGGGGGPEEDWLFNSEYPMIRFLERNGYDISYTTNTDIARDGAKILQHKVFLSVGHDEYWSAEQRAAVEAARDAGVHLAFFSGNEVYWKTRWENSVDGNNTPFRTLVCYKEGDLGEAYCGDKCDPTNTWTGLWRTPTGADYDGAKPENALTGQISWDLYTTSLRVPSSYRNLRFWRNTSVANLGIEGVKVTADGILGYEVNFEQEAYASHNPPGRFTLSRTSFNGKVHKLSIYRHSSGALVFGAGTVQWAWGLDDVHDRGNAPADPDLQQATVNLLADMGVQPGNLMPGLVAATQSTDTQKPISIITTPLEGVTVPANLPVLISGTATDNAQVAAIEISVDGGLTWRTVNNGTHSWQFTWTPTVQGATVIKVRAVDDSGNLEDAGTAPAANAINVIVGPPVPPVCPCTVFHSTEEPDETNQQDPGSANGIVLGMKFKSNTEGFVNGLRFYKSTNDVGTHTGKLWDNSGNLLGELTFANEGASGWVETSFDSPISITANTVYVVSYHSPSGYYAKSNGFFNSSLENGPLTALASSDPEGPNGVYSYSSTHIYPTNTFESDNYWVDVVFNTLSGPDTNPPTITSTTPRNEATNFITSQNLVIRFSETMDPASLNNTNIQLRDAANNLISIAITYDAGKRSAVIYPSADLAFSAFYTLSIKGGVGGVHDMAGNELLTDTTITFSTQDPLPGDPGEGPGGPILVIHSATNPFSRYTAEILRAEGLNHFNVLDISAVNETVLADYDVVILGEIPVTPTEATMFTDFVNAGGTFISFKPDSDLETLLGITNAGGSLSDKYLLINTGHDIGAGLVNETIQFHSSANQYTLNGATSLATLYSDASTATTYAAVTINEVGSNGGKAVAFAYDLPRSIVYTRQGNPAWAGQKRDGTFGPVRSNDQFFDAGGDHWIDFDKIAIPQADEQQRLLSNIIIKGNLHKKPLPKFWFLPQGHKAAVVMTGDDHAVDGTTGRFEIYKSLGPNTPQDVKDWKAIRASSYIYTDTPIPVGDAIQMEEDGFEIALHPTSDCQDFTYNWLNDLYTAQRQAFATEFPGLTMPVTNRMHCMAWSDWATQAKVSALHGIRLDVNYYYWPGSWVQNRPGMYTGSGMPMRFADLDGSLIDVYQVPTQLTDESDIDYNLHISSLLDKALGQEEYFGVFCANMHTDSASHVGSTAIINAALARGVPVISARQMQLWLDGRNNSSFSNISWNANQLGFTITSMLNAYKMKAMLPLYSEDGILTTLTRNGQAATFSIETIKGTQYAFFDAEDGGYIASYAEVEFADINGSVNLQGRPAAPNTQWEVPLTVELYTAGNTTTPAYTYNVNTDASGNFTISNIPVGTYSVTVKNAHTLKRVLADQVLAVGANALNFGTLLEGDVIANNIVSLNDLTALLATFGRSAGNPGFDVRADLNNDGIITLNDLTLLLGNFAATGENP